MRINVLERPSELVIEPLHKRHNTTRNLEDLSRSDGGLLIVIFPLFSTLNDDNLFGSLERLQKLVELLLCARNELATIPVYNTNQTYSFHCS